MTVTRHDTKQALQFLQGEASQLRQALNSRPKVVY